MKFGPIEFISSKMNGLEDSEPFPTAAENKRNTQTVIASWQLGPLKPSVDPKANGEYWAKLAKTWQISTPEARRRFCANCEYFHNDPLTQAKMERIPQNQYDVDAGGRGYCEKFDFICHNLRVCQAWEDREED